MFYIHAKRSGARVSRSFYLKSAFAGRLFFFYYESLDSRTIVQQNLMSRITLIIPSHHEFYRDVKILPNICVGAMGYGEPRLPL